MSDLGVLDESYAQLVHALQGWDYSMCFPASNYTDPKKPIIVQGHPPDQLRNLEVFRKGQMTQPVISLWALPANEEFRTLGGIYKVQVGGGLDRHGKRVRLMFLVQSWADQRLGAGKMARQIAGQVQGVFLYNENRLDGLKALHCNNIQEGYSDAAQLWHADVTVQATTVVSVDY